MARQDSATLAILGDFPVGGGGTSNGPSQLEKISAPFKLGEAASVDILEQQLVSVAKEVPSFAILGHQLTHLKKAAEMLFAKNVKSPLSLFNDTTVINASTPSWAATEETVARKAVVVVREHLVRLSEKIREFDIAVDERAGRPRERRSRSRRRTKRSRRDKSDRSDSSSSASKSERRMAKQDDANEIISASSLKVFGVEAFPEARLVNRVYKHRRKKNGETPSRAYLSTLPLESWTPSWVGADVPEKTGAKIRRQRESQHLSGPQAVENVIAFWATHGLTGSASLEAIVSYVAIFNRMVVEHGVAYACKYQRNLVKHIRKIWVDSTEEDVSSFDRFLGEVVPKVEAMTQNKRVPSGSFNGNGDNSNRGNSSNYRGFVSNDKNNNRGAAGHRQNAAPRPPATPQSSNQAHLKSRQEVQSQGRQREGASHSATSPKEKSDRPVCKYFNTKNGCRNGDKCAFAHVKK